MRKNNGFTLIELLVVIVVISIVTAVALVNMNRNENRRLENYSNEMAQLITLGEEEAILRPAVLGLAIKNHEYYFATYLPEEKGDKKTTLWLRLEDDRTLSTHTLPNDVELSLKVGGTPFTGDTDAPQIILSTSGDITPFSISVGKQGKAPRFIIRGDADGSVKIEKL